MDSARAADFFIVVGTFDDFQRIEEDSSGNPFMKGPPSLRTSFHSFVTDRYPVEDRPGEELPEGIQLFCLPYGVQVSEVPSGLRCTPSFTPTPLVSTCKATA